VRKAFPQGVDYRRLPTTKPHASHPNYIVHDGEDWWVSRFIQHDVVCLTDHRRTVKFDNSPHDGVVFDGLAYFTTIDGHIYIIDLRSAVIRDCIDLNAIAGSNCNLGWARGILPISEKLCWVGFTRLRPTKLKENLSWVRHGFHHFHRPGRIALYDLHARKLLYELNIEKFGLDAVFSILPSAEITAEKLEEDRCYTGSAAR